MSIQVTGTLPTPIKGENAAKAVIRFTSLSTGDMLIIGAPAEVMCDKDGAYDFELNSGNYTIEIKYEDQYQIVGNVLLLDSLEFTGTLGELLTNYSTE